MRLTYFSNVVGGENVPSARGTLIAVFPRNDRAIFSIFLGIGRPPEPLGRSPSTGPKPENRSSARGALGCGCRGIVDLWSPRFPRSSHDGCDRHFGCCGRPVGHLRDQTACQRPIDIAGSH